MIYLLRYCVICLLRRRLTRALKRIGRISAGDSALRAATIKRTLSISNIWRLSKSKRERFLPFTHVRMFHAGCERSVALLFRAFEHKILLIR